MTSEVIDEPELVMNCLAPLTTHSPFSSTALVFVAPASEPGTGLGEAEAGELITGDQRGEPGLLLLVRAVGQDRVDAEAHRGLERDAHRLVDATDLLDGDAQRGEAAVLAGHPGAAELLRSGEAHQAERAHLLHDVGREVVVAVPLRGVRGDLGLGEVADAATELLVLGGQLEGHALHLSGIRLAIANPRTGHLCDPPGMEVGTHLPQVATGTDRPDAGRVRDVVDAARELGLAAVCANDHLAFHRPWLDGPTLLAAVADRTGGMDLATTVALPSLRGPAQLAASLATLAELAPGRVVAGVGPGSSATDHALAGVPYDDRWRRFDESVLVLRGLLGGGDLPGDWAERLGGNEVVAPARRCRCGWPAGDPRPGCAAWPGWVTAGSRRPTTPRPRRSAGPGSGWPASVAGSARPDLPAAVATLWTWVDDDAARAGRMLRDVLAPVVRRDPAELADRVCVGTAEHCARLLTAYADAGCARIHVWPLGDEVAQLERLVRDVLPGVADSVA